MPVQSRHTVWFEPCYRVFAVWYGIWFVVGLFAVGFSFPPLFGHWEDFLFLFLGASILWLRIASAVGTLAALRALLVVAILSGGIEWVGALTGVPFGQYSYSERFGPRLGGVLPLAIPFAWWVAVLPGFLLGLYLRWRLLPTLLLTATGATLFDVGLEPVATLLRGYWEWRNGGPYYGVPWVNFAGWFGTSAILVLVLWPVLGARARQRLSALPSLPALGFAVQATVLLTFLLAALINGLWLAAFILAGLLAVSVPLACLLARPLGLRQVLWA